ncbi:sulfurtransferase TusA family protein [Helcobacillus massiliensis]|uniref:sulfurtransferase TusA family protein n=1 Tax=Helcobacillus massiliensis TaxID=521392 RepID=UPI001EF4D0D3|nr:sulfurtransferase TusA family protein [Helcobacillus massiliensis]MCG7426244.1 sulfurtransferase TusA family protein [Helcobacillus sp. ACRRO]MCT1558585.1 sulfurtransferase TusA family protein [Helcobacillus massiliensis]MCT2332409.1 sulfurtransferase TusA family protein [Helcobacillus massiliensis]MDK7742610.1 sulfurtransferase TusA family protein [Helcobacillus massiliensis]
MGQVCPFPLVEAKRAIEQIDRGDRLQIDFDCTQATDSIPAWAASAGHDVTEFRQLDAATWSITVQKG